MNLQICFVNDSGSDKDSDADDSKTETSLDTPLSPMVGLVAHLTEHKGHNENCWGTEAQSSRHIAITGQTCCKGGGCTQGTVPFSCSSFLCALSEQ